MWTHLRARAVVAAAACLAVASVPRPAAAQAASAAPPAAAPAPSPEANAYLDAVRKGDVAAVQKALDAGVAVDTPFRYGRTALSFAADRGFVDVVRLLLERGAKPDVADTFYNQTALAWASSPAQTRKPEHAQVVKLLLEKGATGGDRALRAAVSEDDAAMVQGILESGRLAPPLLSESLATAKKTGKTAAAAVLEKGGVAMPIVPVLSPAQLTRYPGTFSDGRETVVITVLDGTVTATQGAQKFTLSPRSETAFVVEERGLPVTVVIEGEQAVSFTVVNPFGPPSIYKRVNP